MAAAEPVAAAVGNPRPCGPAASGPREVGALAPEHDPGETGRERAGADAGSPAEKTQWRRRLRQQWSSLDSGQLESISEAILRHLVELPMWASATAVMLYAPLPGEVDVSPLLAWAQQRGLAVLLPWLKAGDPRMEARRVSAWDDTERGPLGLRVPRPTAPVWSPDQGTVVVVPGLAFDGQGWRMGRGAGYYDRFLTEWPGAWRVGVVPSRFLFSRIPHGEHDRRMDWIVTEEGPLGPWFGLR